MSKRKWNRLPDERVSVQELMDTEMQNRYLCFDDVVYLSGLPAFVVRDIYYNNAPPMYEEGWALSQALGHDNWWWFSAWKQYNRPHKYVKKMTEDEANDFIKVVTGKPPEDMALIRPELRIQPIVMQLGD